MATSPGVCKAQGCELGLVKIGDENRWFCSGGRTDAAFVTEEFFRQQNAIEPANQGFNESLQISMREPQDVGARGQIVYPTEYPPPWWQLIRDPQNAQHSRGAYGPVYEPMSPEQARDYVKRVPLDNWMNFQPYWFGR